MNEINSDLGSVRLLFPVLSDLSTEWDQDTYFRKFPLHDLIMARLDNPSLDTLHKEWPEKAKISAFVFLSPTVLLLYRNDISRWMIARISTSAVAGWPGRPLYHPLALYEDMKCTNFKRIHRILKDFLMVLRQVPEEQCMSFFCRNFIQIISISYMQMERRKYDQNSWYQLIGY